VQNVRLAEDIVQDTLLAVLRELDSFEGYSSLKTWIFRILVNQAKSAGRRERRVIAVDGPLHQCIDRPGLSVRWASTGTATPGPRPEDLVFADEATRTILAALAALPARDAQIILRDIQGPFRAGSSRAGRDQQCE
jgi:RNA polymerase sigma-70 factor (ECF subfamily)